MAKKKLTLPINLVTISAGVIVLAFFLPWIKFGGNHAGHEIPDIASAINKVTSLKSWTGKLDINVYLVYALFVVPIGAAAILAMSAQRKDVTPIAWVVAIMPIAGFLYGLIRLGLDVFSYIGLGGWLTILAGVVMVLSLLGVIELPKKKRRRR